MNLRYEKRLPRKIEQNVENPRQGGERKTVSIYGIMHVLIERERKCVGR